MISGFIGGTFYLSVKGCSPTPTKVGRYFLPITGALLGASVGAAFGAEILEWGAQKAGQIVGGIREL